MRSDKPAGIALITGAVAFVAAMAFHPSGGGLEGIVARQGLNAVVHSAAIASVGLILFGFLRLARTPGPEAPYADAALVAFAFAAGAGALAAILNGVVIHGLAERALEAEAGERGGWDVAFTYNLLLNAALANVFIAAASATMLVWSVGMFRIGGGWTVLGACGVAIGFVSLLALFSGHIRHTVHDFGLFVLVFAVWTVAFGALLLRTDTATTNT